MWAIKYSKKQDSSDNKIVALAIDESAVDTKIQQCVLKLREQLGKEYSWISARSETEE
jgi:hypothetical protein